MDNAPLDPFYAAVFTDPKNGTPDNITKVGCLALARLGRGAWNAWRSNYPVGGEYPDWKNIADFSEVDFSKNSINFDGFIFGDFATFFGSQFEGFAQFKGARFGSDAVFEDTQFGFMPNFEEAHFGIRVNFKGAKFGNEAEFNGAQFDKDASFVGTQFGDFADFIGAQFYGEARFVGTQFGIAASFTGTRFSDSTWFSGVQFQDYARFDGAWFGNNAKFIGMNWEDLHHVYCESRLKIAKDWAEQYGLSPDTFKSISFAGAIFEGQADFSGRTFTGFTSFGRLARGFRTLIYELDGRCEEKELYKEQPVTFGRAPLFHNCKLYQDTTFDGSEFPAPSSDPIENDISARAYRTLKQAFSQHQAIREEQLFFRLEMAEEARRDPQFGRRLLFWLYSFFSDYGFSVSQPFFLLWLMPLLAAMPIYSWLADFTPCIPWQSECHIHSDLLQFALIQALPLPGLDKWGDSLRQYLFSSSGWQGIVLTGILLLHKAVSLIAMFLMGLALRNLFKMK